MVTTRFAGMASNPSIIAAVERWADRIAAIGAPLDSCVTEIAQRDDGFRVTLIVVFAGTQIVAAPDRSRAHAHANAYVAVGDAFRQTWHELRRRFALGTQAIPRAALAS
jgi:hypothetical protein